MRVLLLISGVLLMMLSIASATVSNTPNGALCFAVGLGCVAVSWPSNSEN